MIHISILRAMAASGASIEIILAAIEADQIRMEMLHEQRRLRARATRQGKKNGNGNGIARTLKHAVGDLFDHINNGKDAIRN